MEKLNTPKKPAPQDWHVADIKASLEKAGWTLRGLSTHHGFSPNSIRMALRGPWPNAEKIIAAAIGVTPETIWPSRYDPLTRPRRGIGGQPMHKPASLAKNRDQVYAHKGRLNNTTGVKPCNVNVEEVV